MSIMFADDFKGYGTNKNFLLDGLWADINYFKNVASRGTTLQPDPDPLATGVVLNLQGVLIGARRVFPNGSNAIIGCAFRFWMPALPYNGGGAICSMMSAANVIGAQLCVDSVGRIFINSKRVGGAQQGITAVPVLTANAWTHIEVKFTAGTPAAGAVEVRVNGVTVLTLAAIDCGIPTFEQLILGNGESNFESNFKDWVVWNGLGGRNNNFLGTVSVVGLVPNADVSLNWSPSTGTTGWPLIDNSPPDDAAQYIRAPFPVPAASTFDLTNLPANVSSVRGLITQVRAAKEDGGDGNLQASLISGASTGDGADRPITTAFTYYEDVFEIDPNTAAAWTPAAVDAARLKLNRTV